MRQACPISPALFFLYIADVVEYVKNGQRGLVVDKNKFVMLEYVDNLVLVAKTEEELKAVFKSFNVYV